MLQPVDLNIGKPFKDLVRKKLLDWIELNHNKTTRNNNNISLKPKEIILFISSSMKEFNSENILKAFSLGKIIYLIRRWFYNKHSR